MAFGSSKQKASAGANDNANLDTYLRMTEGERIVRILDEEETSFWRYWLNGAAYPGCGKGKGIIVGRDSPIRQHMEALGKDHPDYRAPQRRYLLNVLDRTPVKKTSKGYPVYADGNGNFPNALGDENVSNSPVVPNNRVYVVEFGSQLLDSFVILHNKIKHRNTYELLPIWGFDVKIFTKGSGLETKRMVFPDMDQDPLPEELFALPKYDLAQFTRVFPNAAQERILAGEDFGAIMKELGWERPVPNVSQGESLPF